MSETALAKEDGFKKSHKQYKWTLGLFFVRL